MRPVAAFLTVLSLGLVRFAVPLLEWSNGGRVCPSLIESGVPCMGCGGTRALDAALHGDFLAALVLNPLGAFAGLTIWLLLVVSLSSLVTGWPHFLRWYCVVFGLAAPVVFVTGVVVWWMTWSPILAHGA